MHYSKLLLLLATTFTTSANGFDTGDLTRSSTKSTKRQTFHNSLSERQQSTACPAVWKLVAQDLKTSFWDSSTRQCTNLARQAIRAAFHDCAAWDLSLGETGGCDGSLFLSGEISRPENRGLDQIAAYIPSLVQKYNYSISVADLIQFAAAGAVQICPLGPQVQTFVNRHDSPQLPPPNLIPLPEQNASYILPLFQAKGFNANELAALVGAHTTSVQFTVDPSRPGAPQDDTPGVWDVDFYANTYNPPAEVVVFNSDRSLSEDPVVGTAFKGFVGNQGVWDRQFAAAMTKMSLLGVPGGSANLVDCTFSLPQIIND